mmetsp:Transcript_42350/g.50815  ORF Transcript_42350/g.50815 Transcript_42350/m.50815 type:complete len:93 (+) Transcript_42350:291-569(+)
MSNDVNVSVGEPAPSQRGGVGGEEGGTESSVELNQGGGMALIVLVFRGVGVVRSGTEEGVGHTGAIAGGAEVLLTDEVGGIKGVRLGVEGRW